MNLSVLFGITLFIPLALFIVASLLQNDALAQIAAYTSLPFWAMCLWAFISNFRAVSDKSSQLDKKLTQVKDSLNLLENSAGHRLEFVDSVGKKHLVRVVDKTYMLDDSPSTLSELEAALMTAKPYSIRVSSDNS